MKNIWNKYKREFVVLLATLVMAVVFTVLNSNFLNYNNFVTILQQMVLNGVLAVGMMFTIKMCIRDRHIPAIPFNSENQSKMEEKSVERKGKNEKK